LRTLGLTLALFPPNAVFANHLPAETISAERLVQIQQECFSKDLRAEVCRLFNKPEYQRSVVDDIVDPLVFDSVFLFSAELTGHTLFSLPGLLKPPHGQCPQGGCATPVEYGEALLMSLSRQAQGVAHSQNLRDCQKVCVATCVASRLLKYEKSLFFEFGPESVAVAMGRGACTEYSRVADRLIGDLGIKSYTVGNLASQHQYVWVQLDSGSYYVEPQYTGCAFIGTN
jgi:hypothetical protein